MIHLALFFKEECQYAALVDLFAFAKAEQKIAMPQNYAILLLKPGLTSDLIDIKGLYLPRHRGAHK
jgi:hypothetical protein